MADVPSITMHSSWRSLAMGGMTAGLVALAGTWAVAQAGFGPVPATVCVLGWLLVAVMAFDFPVATTFTADGVQRRMVLRRQWFAWERIDQLTRTRPSLVRLDRRVEHGGLTAKLGRRRYLLVDRCESNDEFDSLLGVLEAAGIEDRIAGMLLRPGEKAPPTWLYRRKRWRPDTVSGR